MSHLFTIVTPAYNAEKFILKAMKSVIDQSEKDFEYIVVDNGSTDRTLEIVSEFIEEHKDCDLKVIRISPNQGISGGRNTGINKAAGKYICLLDADDWWYPDKLKEVKGAIEEHPDVQIIGHWEKQVQNGNVVRIGRFRSVDNSNAFRDLLFHGNCLSPSAVVVEKEMLQKNNGFNLSLDRGQEDFDCWLRLAHDGARFLMIDKPLSVWLIRNDSLSAKRENHTDAVVEMLEHHFSILENEMEDPAEKKIIEKRKGWIYAMNYCGCARTMSINGDRKEAYRMYRKSIGYCKTYWKSYAGILMNVLHI